jgi:hypothetical protein
MLVTVGASVVVTDSVVLTASVVVTDGAVVAVLSVVVVGLSVLLVRAVLVVVVPSQAKANVSTPRETAARIAAATTAFLRNCMSPSPSC